MNILITGASGMIGTALALSLTSKNHSVFALSRTSGAGPLPYWNPDTASIDLTGLPHIHAVIHLAGENISTARWSRAKKNRICNSRIRGTELLCRYFSELDRKPDVIISGSAVGYYGERGSEAVDETATVGTGFLAELCREWEHATQPAIDTGIRVVNIRLGVVLDGQGGALKKMLLPFKLGLGGVLGSGQQFMSWITLDDVCKAIQYVLDHDQLRGPVNLVTPGAVSNREFTKTLSRTLNRPAFFPVPACMVRTLFGEMGQALMLTSIRAYPRVLQEAGFRFTHPEMTGALQTLLSS